MPARSLLLFLLALFTVHLPADASYTYDPLNNMHSKQLGPRTVSLSYNGQNRLSSATDSAQTSGPQRVYSYDARGNVTSDGRLNFVYDHANQPVSISGANTGSFVYDGNYKRVKQVIDGKVIYSVYNRAGQLTYREEDGDPYCFVRMGGKTVATIRTATGLAYLHQDHLGSPVASTNRDGELLWREAFTPFGEQMIQPSANANKQGFTGHITDSQTGLIYMQARYYDPVVPRFLSNDPVGFAEGGVDYFNRYAYTANDPVNRNDPDGQFFGAVGKLVKFAVKGGDLGATFAGAAQDVGTIFSGDASGLERLGAVASLATEIASPVSARDAKGIARAVRGGCCFVAGTEILTDRGMVPIEQIRVGDLVMARDAETGEEAFKPVTTLFVNDEDAVWELVVETSAGTSEIHRVTDNHPYYVKGQGWVEVADLTVGMTIATMEGDPVTLASIVNTGKVERTFNFEVADFHTYFVGDQHVLVHNCNRSQRAATRQAKREAGIPTSQQPVSQTNNRATDGTQVGRQQTFETPAPGGGTQQQSVQVSRDQVGSHAGMPQIEAGTVKPGGQLDSAGRPRIENPGKVRVDFDPEQ